MTAFPLSQLVEDPSIYPRSAVSPNHVSDLVAALESGAKLPPILAGQLVDADSDTWKIIDGAHRYHANLKMFGPDARVQVRQRRYESQLDMIAAAVEANVTHGLLLTQFDKRRVALRLHESGVDEETIGKVLHVPPAKVERILVQVATVGAGNGLRFEPLKRPVLHFQGRQMTEQQASAIRSAPGTSYRQLVKQLREAIRFALLNGEDGQLLTELRALGDDISAYLG